MARYIGTGSGAVRRVAPPRAGLLVCGERAACGFTLIELLIVMTIIGILATAAVPQIWNGGQRASESVLREDLFVLRDSLDQFYADRGAYPQRLDELVSAGYLREIPVDPISDSRDTWIIELVDWELLDEGERPGIWNVHSGAEGNGLDGTAYRDW